MLKSASFIMRDGAMLILTIGLAVAMRLSVKWKDMEQQRQEMLAAQRSTELDNLKSQLNPISCSIPSTLSTRLSMLIQKMPKAQCTVCQAS